ncbi:MAG: 4'-phosphopantetheinyl transferase superfamily protein [Desulfobacteraceae bacterium]|jgi:4'-phosphopantetheinyl transferase
MRLASNEIHLWFTFPNTIQDTDLLSEYRNLLAEEECIKHQQFYFHSHRKQYLVSRALMRTTLSQYTDVAPREWRFSTNQYGRPEIEWPIIDLPLRFNLSHTRGLIVFAVALQHSIGVDLEATKCREVDVAMMARFFTPSEIRALHALPPSLHLDRFFEIWTLKEAYIKARGVGLSIPLDKFSFQIEDDQPLRVSFDSQFNDLSHNWSFWILQPTMQHKAALALQIKPLNNVNLICQNAIPMRRTGPHKCSILRSSCGNLCV